MGCWNETCALTNLPIFDGDRVVAYIVCRNNYDPLGDVAFCYSDHFYCPNSLAIRGKYNDYGSMCEIDDDFSSRLLFSIFNDNDRPEDLGIFSNCYSNQIKNIEDLVYLIERGCVFSKPIGRKLSEEDKNHGNVFCLYMMHEEAFDLVVKNIGDREVYNKNKTYRDFISEDLDEIAKLIKAENVDEERPFVFSIADDAWQNVRSRYIGQGHSYLLFSIIFEKMADQNLPKEFRDGLLEIALFSAALTFMRKSWTPTVGKGSQNAENALHIELTKFITNKKQRWHGEDEEEEGSSVTEETVMAWPVSELLKDTVERREKRKAQKEK